MMGKRVRLLALMMLSAALLMGCGDTAATGGSDTTSAAAETVVSETSESAAAEAVSSEASESAEAEAAISETSESDPEASADSETAESVTVSGDVPADGTYTVDVSTGSSMFHINEADDGKGVLTVENGEMSVHVRLTSKKIVNLFYGTAEEAQEEGAELIEPTEDVVFYDDGTEDEVYGFDIPVPYLDEPFDVAIIGEHGNWYTHEVTVSNPQTANAG